VVSSVVRYGDPKLVHPLSLAAAHCMGEVALSTETRESDHNYPNDHVDEASFSYFKPPFFNFFFKQKIKGKSTSCIHCKAL